MDMETVRKINRAALEAARRSANLDGDFFKNPEDQKMLMNVALALVAGALAYYLLMCYPLDLLKVTDADGTRKLDHTRLLLASGLVALVAYYALQQY
jgi:hypothetical protein